MSIMKFKPIVLPKTALRRTWLLQQADERCNRFARLLAKLDPARIIHHARGRLSAYYTLLEYLDTLFPVFESEMESIEDEGGDPLEYAWDFGIPCDLLGRNFEDRFDDSRHAALSAIEWMSVVHDNARPDAYECDLEKYPALKPIKRQLEEFRGGKFNPKWLKPGRNMTWLEPWEALPDLVRYVDQNTGNFWLDVSHVEISESGGAYPMWSIGEIRAIEREWQQAKPIWERIRLLLDYIDADPANRVWLLLGCLCGYKDARDEITYPKARRAKTLVEVWNV